MPKSAASEAVESSRFLGLLWWLVAAISIASPLVMAPYSYDVFRTPKDVVFVSLSLILISTAVGGALLSDNFARQCRTRSPIVILALLATAWTAITSMTSLRPAVSLWKPLTVASFASFVIAVLLTTKRRELSALAVVFIPAAINAALATSQSTGLWTPWVVDARTALRVRTTGLIGNPNDLGTYLVLPTLAAFAALIAWPHRKWLYVLAVLLLVGIASAQSVTPVIAALGGLFTMALTSSTRRVRLSGLAAVLALVAIAAVHPASRARFARLKESASIGQLPELTSFRVAPAMSALRMFLDRPFVGVGPGSFSALYMTYKLRTDEAFPEWIRPGSENYGQAHNDHLQVLAETGLPGYAILVASLALLGSITFRTTTQTDGRARFARTFALPAAVAFTLLALAQFPLQLTAPMVPALFLGTLCFAWTAPDENH
jgi:O-antigen ligase